MRFFSAMAMSGKPLEQRNEHISQCGLLPSQSILPRVSGFVSKAFAIFSNPAYSAWLGWGHDGNTIYISDTESFGTKVLPNHFKHSNMSSFVRQLNMYGFHKTVANPRVSEFYHPNFRQGCPYLLPLIKRKAPDSNTIEQSTSTTDSAKSSTSTSQRLSDRATRRSARHLTETREDDLPKESVPTTTALTTKTHLSTTSHTSKENALRTTTTLNKFVPAPSNTDILQQTVCFPRNLPLERSNSLANSDISLNSPSNGVDPLESLDTDLDTTVGASIFNGLPSSSTPGIIALEDCGNSGAEKAIVETSLSKYLTVEERVSNLEHVCKKLLIENRELKHQVALSQKHTAELMGRLGQFEMILHNHTRRHDDGDNNTRAPYSVTTNSLGPTTERTTTTTTKFAVDMESMTSSFNAAMAEQQARAGKSDESATPALSVREMTGVVNAALSQGSVVGSVDNNTAVPGKVVVTATSTTTVGHLSNNNNDILSAKRGRQEPSSMTIDTGRLAKHPCLSNDATYDSSPSWSPLLSIVDETCESDNYAPDSLTTLGEI